MNKIKIISVLAVFFCAIGIALMIAQKFIETEWNLSMFSNISLAIGLISFLVYMNSKK